jgi:t-SNARE complex subunit (syntaxin)
MCEEKVIPSFHSFFARRRNMRRPSGPEGVNRSIADARKANLHPHAYTLHIQVIIDVVVVAVVCLLSFFSNHLGSQKDDEKRK